MDTSPETNDVAAALALVQGELQDATKSSFNTGYKSKYADLAEVLQTIRPVSSKHGLSFVQALSYADGLVRVTTRLMHRSGQFLEFFLDVPIAKKDAQGLGGGATYGRRYSLAALFGIAQDDDDGQEAVKKPQRPKVDSGSNTETQGPSTNALALIARFNALDPGPSSAATMKELTEEYSTLTPAEQTQVLGAAKAARTRLEEAKLKTK